MLTDEEVSEIEKELSERENRYIDLLDAIEKLYRKERRKVTQKKNLVITRIYLPEKEWNRLLSLPEFKQIVEGKKFSYEMEYKIRKTDPRWTKENPWINENFEILRTPNLAGIPCNKISGEELKIDVEVVSPRKRKQKAIVYVRDVKDAIQ